MNRTSVYRAVLAALAMPSSRSDLCTFCLRYGHVAASCPMAAAARRPLFPG